MKPFAALLFCLAISLAVKADAIVVGNSLPALTVADKGEVRIDGGALSWQPWSTGRLSRQVLVIEYLAARMTSREMNQAFGDALKARAFPGDKLASITIVNASDALWGTAGLVPGELQKSKKQNPADILVADSQGLGLKAWSLKPEGSAIIVLDKSGRVAFFKEGALTSAEIESTLKLIENLL